MSPFEKSDLIAFKDAIRHRMDLNENLKTHDSIKDSYLLGKTHAYKNILSEMEIRFPNLF